MFLALMCGLLACAQSAGQGSSRAEAAGAIVALTAEERAWLQAHPVVTLALDEINAPMNFRREGAGDASYAGASLDYVNLIARKAGLRLRFEGSTWPVALQKAMDHQVDGVVSASVPEERKAQLNFTEPYLEMPIAMATRRGQQAARTLSDFAGQRIAVVKETTRIPVIVSRCLTCRVIEVSSPQEGIEKVASFEVADSGPGISTEEQTKLFQAVYQTAVGVAKGEGTGLGLTISREFVRLMGGGELRAASTPGQGSVFAFTLTLPAGIAATASIMAEGQGRVAGLLGNQAPPRILIVEDNADSRELICEILRQVGFSVRSVENGQQGIDSFEAWQPQFIWMDMRTRVMDCYAAARAIRALPGGCEVKIVALTASVFEEDQHAILEAGCDAVVRKPLEEGLLFSVMEQLLELRYRYARDIADGVNVIGIAGPSSEPLTLADPDLTVLPAIWRGDLALAAELRDPAAVRTFIEIVRSKHPAVADGLTRLLSEGCFDKIVALCEAK